MDYIEADEENYIDEENYEDNMSFDSATTVTPITGD